MHEKLKGVPQIVPQDVEGRSHGCQRRGECGCQHDGKGGIFLSEGLAGFPFEFFAADKVAQSEIYGADKQ